MPFDTPVPQPGPAQLSSHAGPDEWLEQAKQCKYLPESDMKRLCELVKECLMEGKLSLSSAGLASLQVSSPFCVPFRYMSDTLHSPQV